MSSILYNIDIASKYILESLKRFPMASLSAFIVTVILVTLIEFKNIEYNYITIMIIKIAFVSTIGIFIFPVLNFLSRSLWLKLFGLALIALYYYFLPIVIGSTEIKRHTLLLLALFFMYLWIPFINNHISNKNIWEWTQKILIATLATVILSLTLYFTLAMTMLSIETLFEIKVESRRYIQLFIIVLGIFSVNFFLSQIPKYILLLQESTYSNIGSIFTKYVLTPITIIYMIILFAYSIKTIINQELVNSSMDWMITVYAIVAISCYMFWTPLWERPNSKFRVLIWLSLLLQSLVLALSIWLRVKEGYPVAEFHLLALFSIWLFVISLYFSLFENASYKWFFFSISLLPLIYTYISNTLLISWN